MHVEPRITRNERDLTLDITFALVTGERIFVERIDIEGNNTTLDRVVRNQFRVVEGDPLNPRSIRESAERIKALGYFADAQVNVVPGSSPDTVVVDVNVVEAPTGSLSFGANYSSDVGFGLVGSFRERNFLGRGQTLNLEISTAETNRNFSLDFAEPNFLGRDLRFGLNLSYLLTDNQSASYDTETFRFSPSFTFSLAERSTLALFYGLKYSDITDVTSTSAVHRRRWRAGGLVDLVGGLHLQLRHPPRRGQSGHRGAAAVWPGSGLWRQRVPQDHGHGGRRNPRS